ncbi:MAG TPA: DUF1559 domain-containing protein [Thermoguttaceae bacterium]|nr:DUF1559 domain-containing protein [Thermoguttaceae bacterium]
MTNAPVTPDPPPAKQPFQFTLRSLFVVTAVVALLLGLMVWLGFGGFLLSLLILSGIAAYRRAWTTAILLFVFTVFIPCAMPFCPCSCREAARRAQCLNNLRQLGLALHEYHNVYGSFPPAYVADQHGRPMHSWRVLILPFLEQKDLYNQYRFDEPWDGPNNRKLHDKMPEVFRCASRPSGSNPYETSYVAVTGPHTAWRDDRPVKLSEITDGSKTTILLVEMKDSGINWMEPRDLAYPPMPAKINPPSARGISSYHPGRANVLFADGHVFCLGDDAKPIAKFLTIDGGETISEDDL